MIALRGECILLRVLEREDCRLLWERYEPEAPLPTEPLQPGLSVEQAGRWFDELQAKQGQEQLYLGIFTHAGELLGDVQLSEIDWRHRTAGIGMSIARRADRGQGYGVDAARTILRYAFEHLDLYRVSAAIAAYNSGAQRVLLRCGFTLEGRERAAFYTGGRRWDRLLFGLLREEFQHEKEGEG